MPWKKWDWSASGKGLVPDDIVMTLVPDPTDIQELFVMQGLLGPSAKSNVWRIYRNHALDDYYEVHENDVVFAAPLAEGHRVWITRGAELLHVTQQQRPAEVDYLSGAVAAQVARREAAGAPVDTVGGAEPTACPICPSRSP